MAANPYWSTKGIFDKTFVDALSPDIVGYAHALNYFYAESKSNGAPSADRTMIEAGRKFVVAATKPPLLSALRVVDKPRVVPLPRAIGVPEVVEGFDPQIVAEVVFGRSTEDREVLNELLNFPGIQQAVQERLATRAFQHERVLRLARDYSDLSEGVLPDIDLGAFDQGLRDELILALPSRRFGVPYVGGDIALSHAFENPRTSGTVSPKQAVDSLKKKDFVPEGLDR